MPHNSARTKIEAVESFGIEPVFCEPNAESRDAVAAELQAKTGATLIHPYNNPFVMAGQGTVGLEIVSQVPDVDAIVAPIGGGGLISGILTAVKAGTKSAPWVFGAEPAWADDAFRGLKSGKIEQPVRYDTVADGLRSPVGELTFPIIRDRVEGILLAEESQIWMAVRDITEKAKLVCEPSGAVALAALQSHLTSKCQLAWQENCGCYFRRKYRYATMCTWECKLRLAKELQGLGTAHAFLNSQFETKTADGLNLRFQHVFVGVNTTYDRSSITIAFERFHAQVATSQATFGTRDDE